MDLEVFFGNKHAGPLQAFDVRYTVDTVDQNALQVRRDPRDGSGEPSRSRHIGLDSWERERQI